MLDNGDYSANGGGSTMVAPPQGDLLAQRNKLKALGATGLEGQGLLGGGVPGAGAGTTSAEGPAGIPKGVAQPPLGQPAGQPPMVAPPMNAQAPLGQSTFSGDSNLINQQFTPGADPRLGNTQGLVDSAAQKLAQGPDRQALALQTAQNLEAGLSDQRALGTKQIGKDAARLGRLGSGMVTTSLGDLESRLGEQRNRSISQLSADTAGQSLQDNATRLGALGGLENQQYGQGLGARNEARGERGYQNDLQQQVFGNKVTQHQLEQGDQAQAFGQQNATNGLLAQLGFGGDPSNTLGDLASQYGQNAQGEQAGSGELLKQLFSNSGGQAGSPSGPPPTQAAPPGFQWGKNAQGNWQLLKAG